nr:hypothetical protein [Tanacetum cinerariifolium]
MAEENVLAPTRTDEQAFTALTDVPFIYVQQFWNTLRKDEETGVYSFQLDELWFNLNADLLHKTLGITPKDSTHPFCASSSWWSAVENYSLYDQPMLKRNNIHKRPLSPIHITKNDYQFGNLKFVSKGRVYEKYLDMDARKPHQTANVTDKEGEKKKKALEADEEPQPASEPQVEDDEYNIQRDSTNDAENVVNMEQSNSEADTKILYVEEARLDQTLVKHPTLDLHWKKTRLDQTPRQSHVAQAGPNPKPMHEDFITTINPKNLEDAFTFRDQFINDKSTEEEPGKANVETKVESMVTAPIQQASSHPDHSTLYEALELSMQRKNNDELHAELTRSRKRCRDDQDPPSPPPKDSDRSKKKKHDSNVSTSKQPLVQKSLAWKTFNTREASSSSSKQKTASPPLLMTIQFLAICISHNQKIPVLPTFQRSRLNQTG